ncbi:serine/threonine-protein kinase [Streptomyces boninensis]|uniref:serine/threonine-protein kinase n=1 Tax=Streptomyces boninensis TaxID=2039455 RepID=UPI003B215843
MRDQLLAGRYRLVRPLGEGGMGQVWEAQDETLDRPVAVKLISLLAGGGSRGDEARARFLREARMTARLQHPQVVTVHDLGETAAEDGGQVPFLVMELVRGESLDALRRRGAVAPADAARWGAQICDALTEAHGAGILHRDIKPSNILITPSGAVKVLDFGIARAADPYATADRLTQTGFIVGTPPYMAPEQARGRPEAGSDLYALGCVLFELVTGRLPFRAPDTVGYLSAHLTEEPPAPSAVSPGLSAAWDALVLKLLHKDPAQRYASAAELAGALRQLDRVPDAVPTPVPTVPAQAPTAPSVPAPTAPAAPPAPRSPHAITTALTRFVLPAGLLVGLGMTGWFVLARDHEYGYLNSRGYAYAAVWLLALVGSLGLTAALTPDSSDTVRAAGRAVAAAFLLLTVGFPFVALPEGVALLLAPSVYALYCLRDGWSPERFLLPLLPVLAFVLGWFGFIPYLEPAGTLGDAYALSLALLVGLTAALTPRTREAVRLLGYAAALSVLFFASWYKMYPLPQVLAVAAYAYRDLRTRRARSAAIARPSGPEGSAQQTRVQT